MPEGVTASPVSMSRSAASSTWLEDLAPGARLRGVLSDQQTTQIATYEDAHRRASGIEELFSHIDSASLENVAMEATP
jgi:hypothetical protein